MPPKGWKKKEPSQRLVGREREIDPTTKPERIVSETLPASDAPAPPSENFPGSEPEVKRIGFKVENGKFLTNGFHAKTEVIAKEAMKASLADPEFRAWVGIEKPITLPEEMPVTPEFFGMALDIAANVEVMVLAKRYAVPSELIAPVVKWSTDEHELLDTQGAKIVNKYIPGAWLKYADVYIFAATMFSIMSAKAKMVEHIAKMELEKIGRATVPQQRTVAVPVSTSVEVGGDNPEPGPSKPPSNGNERSLG